MSPSSPFAVLFDRQALARLGSVVFLTLTLAAAVFALYGAQAQSAGGAKIAQDLNDAIEAPAAAAPDYVRDVNRIRYVKALVVSNSIDPDLGDLRSAILTAGGSIYSRYGSISALSVLLPARQVLAIASRSDVVSVSPNRTVVHTAAAAAPGTAVDTGRAPAAAGPAGLDGSGVGIAVLDAGLAWNHPDLADAAGRTRIRRSVDLLRAGDASPAGTRSWTPGVDTSASLYPGSGTMAGYERLIASDARDAAEGSGHASHVAAVAAGRGSETLPAGVAPGAHVFDIRVLDGSGRGQASDVLAGIDWVIHHAREYGIRVINLSLAADSTESYLTDPLCRAVRSAVAAGITVVAAGGNFGLDAQGREQYGGIGAPGNDPSVITVGSIEDAGVDPFSSRGPTRGAQRDAGGMRRADNLLKPDLVAPGRRMPGAAHAAVPGGTSIAAPAVSGTVALMLQANPGLTPPLVKAMLQYSAQPMAGANLLQQGTGRLNIDGAVTLAQALRGDIGTAIDRGTATAGDEMLAAGRTMPRAASVVDGAIVPWSQLIFAGGRHVLGGEALFSRYQPIYDPRLSWVGSGARSANVLYWPGMAGIPAGTHVRTVIEGPASDQIFVSGGVRSATALAGPTSLRKRSGAFSPTATLASRLSGGSGLVLGRGLMLGDGPEPGEGLVLADRLVRSEGLVLSDGRVLGAGRRSDDAVLIGQR